MATAISVHTARPEPGVVALTIEVPVEDFDRAREQAWRRVAQRVDIPGFRRGKAPRALVERRVGPGVVDEEALRTLLPQVYDQAVEDSGVTPIDRPQFSVEHMDAGKPLVVKATVAVQPTVDPGDYGSVRVEPDPVEVTDDEVHGAIERLRNQKAQWAVAEDRPLATDDRASLDLSISWSDGRTADHKALDVVLGENDFPQGFDAQLAGAHRGETREFVLTWKSTDRSGQETERSASFRATVREIRVKQLPELDDEFAKSVGHDSEEGLRGGLRERLLAEKRQAASSKLKEAAAEAALASATFEIPARLVELEAAALAEEQRRVLARQRVTPEQYLQLTGKTAEQWEAEQLANAEKQLKTRLLLDEIAAHESIEGTADEVDEEIERTVAAYGEQADQVRRTLSTPESRRRILSSVRRHKALDWLADVATGHTTPQTGPPEPVAAMEA